MNWINQCEELWGERWKSTLALCAGVLGWKRGMNPPKITKVA